MKFVLKAALVLAAAAGLGFVVGVASAWALVHQLPR